MGEHFQFPEYDMLDGQDLLETSAKTRSAERAYFEQDRQALLMEAGALLRKYSKMSNGSGWAIYIDDLYKRIADKDPHRREVLIYLDVDGDARSGDIYRPPELRIVTNELFEVGEDVQWLCEDFIINRKGHVRYHVDAVNPQHNDREHAKATLFTLNPHNGLRLHGQHAHGPLSVSFPLESEDDLEMRPFGHPESIFEAREALRFGRNILASIEDDQPCFVSL